MKKNTKKQSKKMTNAERAEKLKQARTLGRDALGWVHGGADSTAACCSWKPRVTLS